LKKFRYGYDIINEGVGVIHERIVKGEYINSIMQQYGLQRILEVGSGIGIEMGAGVGVDGLVLAVKGKDIMLTDYAEENLWTAGQVYKLTSLRDKVYLVKAYPSGMPFSSNTFDLVFNSYLVEFADDPVDCIREMARVSRRLVLLFATNYLNVGHFIYEIYGGVIRAPWEKGSKRRTTLWVLRALVKAAGLKLVESGTIDIPPWPSGVAIQKTEEYKRRRELRILNPDTDPLIFRLLKMFYLFEKSMPMFIKILQSHIVYVLAEKSSERRVA